MNFNIYLEKSKKNKKGEAPLRFECGKLRIPSGIKVIAEFWDQSKQRVEKGHPFAAQVNFKITNKKNKLTSFILMNEGATKEEIVKHISTDEEKDEVKPKEAKPTLIEHCRNYILRQKRIKSSSRAKNLKSILDHFESYSPRVKDSEVSFEYLERFTEYLLNEGLENVTVEGYINMLKLMLSDALDSGYKINKDFKDFTFKSGKYKGERLSWEEVEQLDKFEHFNPEYNKIKDAYIFRCNTGLRDIDYNNINEYSFIKKEGKYFVRINSNKKEKDQLLVLNSRALEIAKKYNFNLPKCSQQQFNRIIKIVGRAAKLKSKVERIRHNGRKRVVTIKEKWETISTHGARRTFARRWYDLGGSIGVISHFLGHDSEAETRHYIGLDDDDTNNEMIRVFDQGEIFK